MKAPPSKHCWYLSSVGSARRMVIVDISGLSFLTFSYQYSEHEDTVLFFGELVRQGLFSHDLYVRYLISSGMLDSCLRLVDDMV